MVNQSKKYEDLSGIKPCSEVADFVYNTIYNYLTDCQEKYAYPEFLNFFNKAKKYDKNVFGYFCSEAYESTKRPPITIDNINKFKMLQLAYAAEKNCNLEIKEGVIQHIEVNSNEHSFYMMYEPLTSFDDFERSVGNFCRLNPNSSGTYITPIFQNNKFYLGLVDIENGRFNKDDMKIYVPKDQESTTKTAKSCMWKIRNIFGGNDISKNELYNFSEYKNGNMQRDSSDDDGPVVELVTTSSDKSQDMLHTQHDVPNHDNTQHNGFKFDEENHFFWNIPNSYFLIDSDIDHSNQRALTEYDIDFLCRRIDNGMTVLDDERSSLYTRIKPIKEKLQKGENITFEQVCHEYCGISGERLIIGDVEFLQSLCGIEKGATFDWFNDVSAEMYKQNQKGELIYFHTLPKVYHYNAFGQIMRDFLDKNQNFSGIFAITCSTRDEDYEIDNTELCYFLTTVEIKNGKITQINTSGGSWNGADSDSGVLAAERLDALLSSVSYEAYRCQYCDDKYLSLVESSIGEEYKSNSYKQREQYRMEFNQLQFNMSPPLHSPGPQNMPPYEYSQNPAGHDSSNGSSSYFYDTPNRENSFFPNTHGTGELYDNDSGAGFREVSLDEEYKGVKYLLQEQADFHQRYNSNFAGQIGKKSMKSHKDIKFGEIFQCYNEYKNKISFEPNDVKILQTLCGLEQGANFSVDSDGNTYMTKKNDSNEDICVCTTPVSYDDERFRQILQNFLKTHQNFSGIFVITCNNKKTNDSYSENGWFLTTCQIENGRISNTHTNPIQDGVDDFTRGIGVTYGVNQLLSNQSYEKYKSTYPNNPVYSTNVQSLIHEVNFANNGHRTNFSSAQTTNNGKPSLNEYDPFEHLRIPWDPQNNWKPLPINDDEFETERDCPFPFEWDDPDPLTLNDRIDRMMDVLNGKDIGEPNNTPLHTPERIIIDNDKPIIHIEEPSKPRYILYSDDDYENTRSSGTYVPQRPGSGRKPFNTLPPQFGNLPPIPNMPPYNPGSQNPYRGNPNFDLHGMPNNMPQFYVCDGFNWWKFKNEPGHEVQYYFDDCRRMKQVDTCEGDVFEDLHQEAKASHDERGEGNFEDSWKYFYDQRKDFQTRLDCLRNGYWLNVYDMKILQLRYAEEVKRNTQDQVIYHCNPVQDHQNYQERLGADLYIITEIKKADSGLSYFMIPHMSIGSFNGKDRSFLAIQKMVEMLPGNSVKDGIYLIPTCNNRHWELTCVKKQGDSLEYFVTGISSNGSDCGINTTGAMQYVIENGYETAYHHYRKKFHKELNFGERMGDEEEYVIRQEEPLEPHYAPDFGRDQSWDNRYMGFGDTYVPQRPGPGKKIEPPYFKIFTHFIESGTSWTNYHFSFEDEQLDAIFQDIKDNGAWNDDIMRRNLRERFDQVSSSNDGRIALQYKYQGRQIKETIDLKQIGSYDQHCEYNELKEEEEKKLTRFLFHCEVAEMMKIAEDLYGNERIPDIKLDDIFNSGEACNVQIGQKQIGFVIREPKKSFLARAADILCTDVREIQKTLSNNYFQDNLTISVDGDGQEITSAPTKENIQKMYFDIVFNEKSFTCTVLGKQRRFDRLLPGETFVDSVTKSFESAHLVTGFDALSTDIEKKHGKITYKVGDEESDKKNFLSALYHQAPCTMSYYVNGEERRIRRDTRTGWQDAIKTMQEDAKADGLEAYKQQIRSSTILQKIKTNDERKFGGDGDFSCEIVVANGEYRNKNLSTILPNCLEEDGSVNFKFKVHGREYELEPGEWSHGQTAEGLSKGYEQQIASYYIASSIFNSDVDKIKINGQEIEINKTDGSDNYQAVQRRLHTALQNKEYIELFIEEKHTTISTKNNVIKNTDNALAEVRLEEKDLREKVDAFRVEVLSDYKDDSKCFNQAGVDFYFINENGENCTEDIYNKCQNNTLKAEDLRNCKIRERYFKDIDDASYDIDFYGNVLSGQIDIIKKDIEYAHDRFFLLLSLNNYRSKGQEDDTEYTYKFLKDGIEQTKHDDDTNTQLIYKDKSGEEITYTLPAFNNPDGYDIDLITEIIPEFKPATQDVQVFNDMNIDQRDVDDKVYIKVNGEQKDDCYIEGLSTNKKLNTLQDKFDFLTRNGRLLEEFQRLIKLHYKGKEYICSHAFPYNRYIIRDNFQKNFDNFATILDMQEQGFIQVQYSNGDSCDNQDLYKAICYKKGVGGEEIKTVQIVYGGEPTVLEPDEGYKAISEQLRDLKKQQEKDVKALQKALDEAGLELNTTADSHQLYIEDKKSKQAYFFGIEGGDYLAINKKENTYAKLLNAGNNIIIEKFIDNATTQEIKKEVTINSLPTFKECLNAIVQNELNDTLDKYATNVTKVDRGFGFEDVPDPTSPKKHTITLCGNQTITYDNKDVKSMRDAQKKVECAPHPLLAQGISGGFLENSLTVDNTGYVKIKPKHCNEEYQLFTRQGGRDQPVQDVTFKGKNTKEILDAICQKYSGKPNMQICAKNKDDIATVAIPLYASTAQVGDKDRFFDSFYQSFEKLELYNRLKKIREDGEESKIRIKRADNSSLLVVGDKDLEGYFKAVKAPVLVKCKYGESNEQFEHRLNTNYDNPLDDNTFNDVDQYIENTINSKPSKDAEEVLSRIKYNTTTNKTHINGRDVFFFKVHGRIPTQINLVEDDKKPGFIDYKKLHKTVKCFKDTDKLRALYKTSDGGVILSDFIGLGDSSLKEFVDRVDLADQIYQMQNNRKIKNLEIFDTSTKNNIDITGKNAAQIYNLIKNKDNLSIKFKTRGQSIRTKIKCNAGGLRKLKRIQKVTTKTITDNKDLVDVKDFDMPVEVDTDVDNEIIQESESQLINKNYDPFEDIENNPELRKLVELFIEQSDPDMLATIKNNELITCLNSGTIIRNFRNSAKYEKDYLANSPDATNTMEYIKELDEILKKDGDFYDKCNCYDDTGIKLSKTNLHELQLLAIQEYLQSHDTQKAKYFTSDKANGPNYIYLEDKKMLISLSPEKYDDSKCDNKELEELLKNTSITKVTTKKEGDDWVLDCYLDKDKEHLIVDSRNDGRQYDNVSGGIWAARATNEIIELGVENFQILNTYRQTVQDYPEFLKGETGEDLNRIKLSMREFKRCKEEEQTIEKLKDIIKDVANKTIKEVNYELKYVAENKDAEKRKKDKEKKEKEEIETQEKKEKLKIEMEEEMQKIHRDQKDKKFITTTASCSAALGFIVGGPIGIVVAIGVGLISLLSKKVIERNKQKHKEKDENIMDKNKNFVENKPLLEAQPSLGNEVYNDSEKSKKDTTKLLAEDLSKVFTKDLDLNTSSIPVDNIKVKKKAQVR